MDATEALETQIAPISELAWSEGGPTEVRKYRRLKLSAVAKTSAVAAWLGAAGWLGVLCSPPYYLHVTPAAEPASFWPTKALPAPHTADPSPASDAQFIRLLNEGLEKTHIADLQDPSGAIKIAHSACHDIGGGLPKEAIVQNWDHSPRPGYLRTDADHHAMNVIFIDAAITAYCPQFS